VRGETRALKTALFARVVSRSHRGLFLLAGALPVLLPLDALPDDLPGGHPVAVMEMESGVDTFDGCTACGCRLFGEVKPGETAHWWWTFGRIERDGEADWKAAGPPNHCGAGTFGRAEAGFRRTAGDPYVILDLAADYGKDGSGLRLTFMTREFGGFDETGRPDYSRTEVVRTRSLETTAEAAHPMFLPDEQEKEAFAVHDVVVRVRAERVLREQAVYGSLAVRADVPGAEILLDGASVGRVPEGAPVVLSNLPVGTKETAVRDFSGREARQTVIVEEDRVTEAAFRLLKVPSHSGGVSILAIGANPEGQEEYWRPQDSAVMVEIPGGEFPMGSPDDQGQPDEHPLRTVFVSQFLIDKTEVTWRQFRRFANATGRSIERVPIWGTPDHFPASFILWDEARAYCEWVGGRLPTEAEWEKAARGTDGRQYPWGDRWDARRCNSISGGLHQPEPVGSYPGCVSPYGVLDMSGSMWEWCADRYAADAYKTDQTRDPRGPASGRLRVKRGGAWMSQPTWLRGAYRAKAAPTSRNADNGFRCARDVPENP
jgi:formylglycine-generating enzyme required for sulfatase activity